MLDHEKKVLRDFDKILTDCWKEQRSDENSPIYIAVMEKKRKEDEEILQAIRIGLMMGFSGAQKVYQERGCPKFCVNSL